MHVVEAVLLLMVLVIVSNVISHYVVAIPVSLIQAALGLFIAVVFKVTVDMQTDWFMLLFIAPLLYNDGRRFPRKELWALRGPIIGNAIFLVFAITLVGGAFIHWLIPTMPLAASFALAAIMAPTDPIAVHSIAKRAALPSSVLHLVSGESLINDASGLIGFKYGIAATLSGTFILGDAALDFAYVAIVGALAGAVLMLIINALRGWLLQQGLNDVILHTVLQIVTPFVIYLLVDEGLRASGVIAVVVAGLMTDGADNRYIAALPELRIVAERMWDIIVYTLNGIIFLLLGIELPVAMTATIQSRAISTSQALLDVVLVYVVMLALRAAWTYGYMWVASIRAKEKRPSVRTAILNGFAGVRGAVTLVGVLAVPLTLADGQPFPERSLMLFIAAGFIVLSLVAAVVAIPLFTKSHQPLELRGSAIASEQEDADETSAAPRIISPVQAQRFAYQMAMRRLESERREHNQKPVLDLILEYQEQLRRLAMPDSAGDELPQAVKEEIELRDVGLTGELERLGELSSARKISERTFKRNQRLIMRRRRRLQKMTVSGAWRMGWAVWFDHAEARVKKWLVMIGGERLRENPHYIEQLETEKELAKSGLKYLSAYLKEPEHRKHGYNRQVIYALIVQYRNRIASIKALATHQTTRYEVEMQRLRAIALAAERAAVHELLEQGYITTGMAQHLNQGVNFKESAAALADPTDA